MPDSTPGNETQLEVVRQSGVAGQDGRLNLLNILTDGTGVHNPQDDPIVVKEGEEQQAQERSRRPLEEYVDEEGNHVLVYDGGDREVRKPDGTVILYFQDVTSTYNPADGTLVDEYTDAYALQNGGLKKREYNTVTGVTVETFSNGDQVVIDANGMRRYSGSYVEIDDAAAGVRTYLFGSGMSDMHFPDGTVIRTFPDGSQQTFRLSQPGSIGAPR